nr:proline-rich protein 36-like [Aegilops tauschii subsp. strangulata]
MASLGRRPRCTLLLLGFACCRACAPEPRALTAPSGSGERAAAELALPTLAARRVRLRPLLLLQPPPASALYIRARAPGAPRSPASFAPARVLRCPASIGIRAATSHLPPLLRRQVAPATSIPQGPSGPSLGPGKPIWARSHRSPRPRPRGRASHRWSAPFVPPPRGTPASLAVASAPSLRRRARSAPPRRRCPSPPRSSAGPLVLAPPPVAVRPADDLAPRPCPSNRRLLVAVWPRSGKIRHSAAPFWPRRWPEPEFCRAGAPASSRSPLTVQPRPRVGLTPWAPRPSRTPRGPAQRRAQPRPASSSFWAEAQWVSAIFLARSAV